MQNSSVKSTQAKSFLVKLLSSDYTRRREIKVNTSQSYFNTRLSKMQQLKAILHSTNMSPTLTVWVQSPGKQNVMPSTSFISWLNYKDRKYILKKGEGLCKFTE